VPRHVSYTAPLHVYVYVTGTCDGGGGITGPLELGAVPTTAATSLGSGSCWSTHVFDILGLSTGGAWAGWVSPLLSEEADLAVNRGLLGADDGERA
jgi:hypothetical protein